VFHDDILLDLVIGLEVDVFVLGILAFPSYLVVFWEGSFEDSYDPSSRVQGQVSETDINSLSISMAGPLVVYMVGVMGGDDGR
jgi:hypothetical protein